MNNTPIKYKDLDLSKLSFSNVRKNNNNPGKTVFLNYNGGQMLVQMPNMLLRGNPYTDKDTGVTKYYVNLSFYGEEDKPNRKVAHDIMSAIDDKCRAAIQENCREWLGKKKLSSDVVEENYKPCVRTNVNKDTGDEYADDMRIKVTSGKTGGFSCSVFDSRKNDQGTHDEIELTVDNFEDVFGRNVPSTCLLQCTGLWFTGNNYGIGWKLVQARVRRAQGQIREYAFVADSDDEDDGVDSTAETGNAAADSDAEDDEGEGEGDDSDSSDDEEEETAPPPAKAAKKAPRKARKSAASLADKA